MKLSEAMMLGSTTCKMEAGDINSCALGCAGNAVGVPQMFRVDGSSDSGRYFEIAKIWPWILEPAVKGARFTDKGWLVWAKFDTLVCRGSMTFEALVDYVRSIEPDCGKCNRFDCTCVQKMDSQNATQTETVTTTSF